jgi:glycosyltransferase involved in cell wall biosynthesis
MTTNTIQPAAWQKLPGVKKPKVLLYYPDFGATGGIERFLIGLAKGLLARGLYQPVLVCSADTPFYQMALEAGLDVRGVRTYQGFVKPGWRWLDLLTLAQLKLILEAEQPGVVHVHIGQLENVWLRWMGYPMVYSFHGYGSLYSADVSGVIKRMAKKVLRPLFRFTARQMERLVFVSHYEHDRMLAEGYLHAGTCPVDIVHNAIDAADWQRRMAVVDRPAFRQLYGIPDHARCISFINRLDSNKNPLGFIGWAEGYMELYQQAAHPDPLMFLMVGDGPLAGDTVLAISNSPIRNQIRFLGFQADIATVLANTDVAVFLPHREGFGIGILECVTVGVPVAAPRLGGIPEIFSQDLGEVSLYTPHNWAQLSERVTHWLQMPHNERQQWQHRLQTHAQRFSPDHFLDRFEQIYQDCV